MKYPELEVLPGMVSDPGANQRPLTVERLLRGERLRVGDLPQRAAAQSPSPLGVERAETQSPSPLGGEGGVGGSRLETSEAPTITTLEELEALAEREVLPEHEEDEEGDADSMVVETSSPKLAVFHPPAVAIDTSITPLTPAALRERIAHDCLERLAGLAEHRARWPLADKAETERRCLAQVDGLICLGAPAMEVLTTTTPISPWLSWATVFALACIDGREPLGAIADHVAALAPDQREHRRLAAEAFAASQHPHAVPLARACMTMAGAEPFALELLSLRGLLQAADLEAWLRRPEPELRATVLRAYTRLPEPPANVARLEALLDTPDADLAWEASRALTLWSSGAPLAGLRHGSTLLEVLGPRALELLVLAGHHDDVPLVQRLVRRLEPTAKLLDAVARLGHPGTWAFLAHFLGDPILEDDAVAALRVTFGDLVPEDARRDPERWEKAIGAMRLSPSRHLRRGRDWSPAVVAAECADDSLSRFDVERRLDELRARSRVRVAAPLWAMSPLHASFASDLNAALRRAGAIR